MKVLAIRYNKRRHNRNAMIMHKKKDKQVNEGSKLKTKGKCNEHNTQNYG